MGIMERRSRHEAEMLKWLRENGSDTSSARNSVRADADAHFELGQFDHDDESQPIPAFDDKRRDGFIIRGRRDAQIAATNAGEALDGVERLEKAVARVEAKLQLITTLLLIGAGGIVGGYIHSTFF